MSLVEFDPPERFVAGTVGPPGQRTFFLQAGSGSRRTTVSIEKIHVGAVADQILGILEGTANLPSSQVPDNGPLDTPFDDEFRVTALALSWDAERERIVLECHDRDPDGDDADRDLAVAAGLPPMIQSLRIVLAPAMAAEFARRTKALISAGRPPCPFCGGPLDPTGHICPRANGYKR